MRMITRRITHEQLLPPNKLLHIALFPPFKRYIIVYCKCNFLVTKKREVFYMENAAGNALHFFLYSFIIGTNVFL